MALSKASTSLVCDEMWPPGFRFHPTDEELILYYLKRKMCRRRLKFEIVAEIDVYKFEPEELPGLSFLKNGDRQWFFFSPRDRKYPNGSRSNRATRLGYWKATGKDRTIRCNSRNVGTKKTLVFYCGRAPSGTRTDWVMHEYALDEDELKRCQNAQDYYALYKVFKKSGPGPKNGEQYGAHFREEDWVDDDCREIISNGEHASQAQLVSSVADDPGANVKDDGFFDNIDEIMKHIVDEPAPQPSNVCYDFEQALLQFAGEEDNHSTMVNEPFGDALLTESYTAYAMSNQQNDLQANFDVAATATSGFVMPDVHEVTSSANALDVPSVEGEDFLEMNDLLGPESVGGFDLYYDADSCVCDFGCAAPGVLPNMYDPKSLSVAYPKTQEGGWVNQVDLQMQSYPEALSAFGDKMLSFDPSNCLPTTAAPTPGPIAMPTTGDVYAGISASIGTESNKNHNGKDVEGTQSWFSSTLWSFVESIPAAPASATESALVNKAFLRMSSFSRVRINPKSTFAAAGSVSGRSASAGVGGRMKGFFFLSFLAALFAFACVFIGSNASVFAKLHSRVNM